jgi:hypothetical protein
LYPSLIALTCFAVGGPIVVVKGSVIVVIVVVVKTKYNSKCVKR